MSKKRKIEVSVENQELRVIEDDKVVKTYVISTGKNGEGTEEGSLKTPLGKFSICSKIGDGEAPGTIFRGRVPIGQWKDDEEVDEDLVLTRILWLDGKDEDNANTKDRYIYIHGTNQEKLIGQKASHGCIRMRNADVVELFDGIEEETEVEIV